MKTGCALALSSKRDGLPVHRGTRRVTTVTSSSVDAAAAGRKLVGHVGGLSRRPSVRAQIRSRFHQWITLGGVFERLDAGQTGGVYMVSEACPKERMPNLPMAIFKADCEEGFLRRGITPGDGAAREEAAYLLDRLAGSAAGVPVTIRAAVPVSVLGWQTEADGKAGAGGCKCMCHKNLDQGHVRGAVQSFVPNAVGAAEDFGMPRDLDAAAHVVSVAEAQQIASFDLRLCNTDRHPGNILFQCSSRGDLHPVLAKGMYRPVPIDHGCALPRWWAIGEANFEAWLDWPQVHAPCMPEVLDVVEDAFAGREQAVQVLAELGIEPAAQATYFIAVTLLHEGTVRHGLTLAAVAGLLSGNSAYLGEPSWVEERMEEIASRLGLGLGWTENRYGDRVLAPPSNMEAWPPEEFLNQLLNLFSSRETAAAGRQWQENHGHLKTQLAV